MAAKKNYTVAEVGQLFMETVTDTFAVTTEGQAHLNRIAKAITNESLDQRKVSQRGNYAEVAFNKKLQEIASATPDKVAAFLAGKVDWKEKYIARKYGTDEE